MKKTLKFVSLLLMVLSLLYNMPALANTGGTVKRALNDLVKAGLVEKG